MRLKIFVSSSTINSISFFKKICEIALIELPSLTKLQNMKNSLHLLCLIIALSSNCLFAQTTPLEITPSTQKIHHVGKKTSDNFAIGSKEEPVSINEYVDFLNQKGNVDNYLLSYKYFDESFMKENRFTPNSKTCILRSGEIHDLQYTVVDGRGDYFVDAVPSVDAQKEFKEWREEMKNYPTSEELCTYINDRLTYLYLGGDNSKLLVGDDEAQFNYLTNPTQDSEEQATYLKKAISLRRHYPAATETFNQADGVVALAPDHFFNRETWDDNGGKVYLEGTSSAETPLKSDRGSSQDPLHFLENFDTSFLSALPAYVISLGWEKKHIRALSLSIEYRTPNGNDEKIPERLPGKQIHYLPPDENNNGEHLWTRTIDLTAYSDLLNI